MGRKAASIPPVREWRTVPPIVTAKELMALIPCGSSHLEDLIKAGLPLLNFGFGRDRKMRRFEPEEVIGWLRARSRNGGGA